MRVKNLRWFPSASFPCHEHLTRYLSNGTIHHIEGSLNGPLGRFASEGRMRGEGILRSHGTRYQAIQDGEVHVDIAVIAAPSADMFGNANGVDGPSACGPLGFALADSMYADRVIVVTDHLVPFPCVPWAIQGNTVDHVVVVPTPGRSFEDRQWNHGGHTQPGPAIDRRVRGTVCRGRRDHEGWVFVPGWCGGTSLAFVHYLRERMQQRGIKARFVRGGSTRYLVDLLKDGLTDFILDGQAFDQEGVRSMREDPRHLQTSPLTSYNYHGKGNFASMVDVAVLGATEVDLQFNANVVTHSDGVLLHGIGGWQDCLFAKCSILAIPSFRDRIPVIVDRVTTLCGPGELVDVVVTERGIAINPRRKDLLAATRGAGLPLRSLEEIQEEIFRLCGGRPDPPVVDPRRIVAAVKWVDGTLLDTVYARASVEGPSCFRRSEPHIGVDDPHVPLTPALQR